MIAKWLVLVWRLPMGSSTPRVTTWRSLKRLGAATLTPGAALLPWSEDLLEQLGWIAQEVDEMGGSAWVLPVAELSEIEESAVRRQVNAERRAEYAELTQAATDTVPSNRELAALQRRLQRIRARDHFDADGRLQASRAVENRLAAARVDPRPAANARD